MYLMIIYDPFFFFFFFFNDTATTEIYTFPYTTLFRSLVKNEFDRIYTANGGSSMNAFTTEEITGYFINVPADRKSTRLNSSHSQNSYAVFFLKKKKNVILHKHSMSSTTSSVVSTHTV